MLRNLIVVGMLGLLFSQAIAFAAEKEDWLPTSSTWTGKGHAKDAKGVEYDRNGVILMINSRDGDQFGGTLEVTSEGRGTGGKVEVEGTISSTRRLNMKVTKVLQGQPPEGFLEAKLTGRIVEEGKKMTLQAEHPSGSFVMFELSRGTGDKKD